MFNNILNEKIESVVSQLYACKIDTSLLQVQKTRENFIGDVTLVVFPLAKILKSPPQEIATKIGQTLLQNEQTRHIFSNFNVVQGFLNLSLTHSFLVQQLIQIYQTTDYGKVKQETDAPLMVVEYSSPNTNKPLHLGHVRNNLLGYSIAKIQAANGWRVLKTNIVNDRGIHICKSMLAWQRFGNNETPQSTQKKGDHLVGDYYVKFDTEYKKEINELVNSGMSLEDAKEQAPLIQQARTMLQKWEKGDKEIRDLWNKMNTWVYQGFDQTYKKLGIDFDKIYYESETYEEGKKEVLRGLALGIFYQKEDGSVWANLHPYDIDDKLLLRSDGTSVYMTQDIGTAKKRYEEYPINKMVYVVGNEQEHHFKVLSIVLDLLGFPFGKELVHYSYGMVELPSGKMKSREGTVVDADELIDQMINEADKMNEGKVNTVPNMTNEEKKEISRIVGLGALKYFILKVDPKKNMLFKPDESIEFTGNTGPFIQYTYARIQSIFRKLASETWKEDVNTLQTIQNPIEDLLPKEIQLILDLSEFPDVVHDAGQEYNPAVIANFAYTTACDYNSFYHDHPILNEQDANKRTFRLLLSATVAKILFSAFDLLGIEMPEKM